MALLPRVTWYLTHRCNIECTYCRTIEGPQMTRELSQEDALDLADKICEMKPQTVILTGGEPTLVPHLQLIIDRLNFHDQDFVLISNGVGKRAARLQGVRNLSCSVDVLWDNGSRRPRLDQTYKSQTGYAMLKEARARGWLATASIVAHTMNYRNVPALVRTLSEQRIISFVCVIHGAPLDDTHPWRFRSRSPMLNLKPGEARWLSTQLLDLRQQGALILNDVGYLAGIGVHGATLDWHCSEGADLVIDSDGSVMTCSDWWGPRCKAQNVLAPDFTLEGWRDAFRRDNKACPGCFWQCTYQAESSASSFIPEARL